ncbi:Cys-Gln thioester bond-forming surface protein [Thermophilibacter sp.]
MSDTRRRRWARRGRGRVGRRLAAAAAALALVLSEALGVAAAGRTAAQAAEPAGSVTVTWTGDYPRELGMYDGTARGTSRYESNGLVLYCADAGLTGPAAGTTLSGTERGGLTLDYILHYGYGGAGYRGNVRGRTGEAAQAITQLAVWWATSAPNGRWERRALAEEGRAFYEEARSAAVAGGAYAGST